MLTILFGAASLLVVASVACLVAHYLEVSRYDEWVREFEANGGISWGVADVLDGSTVVSYTHLGERRKNR